MLVLELLTDSYLGSLILRSIDVKGCPLCLYLSTLSTELLVVLAKLIIFLMGDLIYSQSWWKSPILLVCKYLLGLFSLIS